MFSFYKSVKNRLRGEYGDSAKKSTKEETRQLKTKSNKPDHSILDLAERGEIDDETRLKNISDNAGFSCAVNNSKAAETQANSDNDVSKRKILKPTKFFSTENKEKHLPNGPNKEILEPINPTIRPDNIKTENVKNDGDSNNHDNSFDNNDTSIDTDDNETSNDIPKLLSMEEFAEISGIRYKIEQVIRKFYVTNNGRRFCFPYQQQMIEPEQDVMQRACLQDLCKEESAELFNRYRDHYENYAQKCRSRGMEPVKIVDAIEGRTDFGSNLEDVEEIDDTLEHGRLINEKMKATANDHLALLNSLQEDLKFETPKLVSVPTTATRALPQKYTNGHQPIPHPSPKQTPPPETKFIQSPEHSGNVMPTTNSTETNKSENNPTVEPTNTSNVSSTESAKSTQTTATNSGQLQQNPQSLNANKSQTNNNPNKNKGGRNQRKKNNKGSAASRNKKKQKPAVTQSKQLSVATGKNVAPSHQNQQPPPPANTALTTGQNVSHSSNPKQENDSLSNQKVNSPQPLQTNRIINAFQNQNNNATVSHKFLPHPPLNNRNTSVPQNQNQINDKVTSQFQLQPSQLQQNVIAQNQFSKQSVVQSQPQPPQLKHNFIATQNKQTDNTITSQFRLQPSKLNQNFNFSQNQIASRGASQSDELDVRDVWKKVSKQLWKLVEADETDLAAKFVNTKIQPPTKESQKSEKSSKQPALESQKSEKASKQPTAESRKIEDMTSQQPTTKCQSSMKELKEPTTKIQNSEDAPGKSMTECRESEELSLKPAIECQEEPEQPRKLALPKRNFFVQSLLPHLDLVKEPVKVAPSCRSRRVDDSDNDNDDDEFDSLFDNIEESDAIERKPISAKEPPTRLTRRPSHKKKRNERNNTGYIGNNNKKEELDRSIVVDDLKQQNEEKEEDMSLLQNKQTDSIVEVENIKSEEKNDILLNIRQEITEMQRMMTAFSIHTTFYRSKDNLGRLRDAISFTDNMEESPPIVVVDDYTTDTVRSSNTDEIVDNVEKSVVLECQEQFATEKQHQQRCTTSLQQNDEKVKIQDSKETPARPCNSEKEAIITTNIASIDSNDEGEASIPQPTTTEEYEQVVEKIVEDTINLEDGPMILYVDTTKTTTATDHQHMDTNTDIVIDHKDKHESVDNSKKSPTKKITNKKIKAKDQCKQSGESNFKDLLFQLPSIKHKRYSEWREQVIEMYNALHPGDTLHPVGTKIEGNANLAKSVKDISNMADNVLFCSIDVRRCLKNFPFPQQTTTTRSERGRLEILLKKSCKALNERLKGNTCPLSFNDEQIQEHIKKGIIDPKLQSVETSCASVYKGRGDRTLVLLNFIEHVRVIVSSRKGDLKRIFSEALFILTSLEENLSNKNQTSFLRDDKLGYINPTIIGNAFSCSVEVVFHCLDDEYEDVREYITVNGFTIGAMTYSKKSKRNIYRIDNKRQFGVSEVEVLKNIHQLMIKLYEVDRRLEFGQQYEDLLSQPLSF